jgi:glycerophosphoryl diester phosphodiesterase
VSRDPAFCGSPTILGHRGLGHGVVDGHRENTVASFLAAAQAGVDWLEVDVRRTADDALMVLHDPAWEDGVFVADVDADEARRRGALPVVDLLAVLPPDVGIDFDLKTCMEDATRARTATTAALLAPVAGRLLGERPVAVTSFDPAALAVVRELAAAVPVGLLTWLRFPTDHAVAAAGHLDVDFLAIHSGSLVGSRVEPAPQHRPFDYVVGMLHAAGRQLLAWCPEPDLAAELVAAGADAVCVNDVPAALPRIRGRARQDDPCREKPQAPASVSS